MLANLFLKENETAASPAARGRIGKFLQGFADRCQTGAFVVYFWL